MFHQISLAFSSSLLFLSFLSNIVYLYISWFLIVLIYTCVGAAAAQWYRTGLQVTGRAINPAPGACFNLKLHLISPGYPLLIIALQ